MGRSWEKRQGRGALTLGEMGKGNFITHGKYDTIDQGEDEGGGTGC